jgi:putative transposase
VRRGILRFPPAIISHGGWLSCRLGLSSRAVAELLCARGLLVTEAAIRQGCQPCGPVSAYPLRHGRPQPGERWHLNELFLTMRGTRHDLGRAGAPDGQGLDLWGQRRRDQHAAQQGFRKRLKGCQDVPRGIVTDQRKRDGAAKRDLLPGGEPRQRERRMEGFTSTGQAQRFLSADGPIAQHVRPRRPRLSAPTSRHVMAQRFQRWHEVTGTAAASRSRSRSKDTPSHPIKASTDNKLTRPST